jgi:hypothetical protein
MGLSVPQRKHITSPLRDQQVNAIYRFLTTVYHNSRHYSSFCLYLKRDVSVTEFCLRVQMKPTQLEPIDSASLCLRTAYCKSKTVPATELGGQESCEMLKIPYCLDCR